MTNDYIFKTILGKKENKSMLIDLLEGILDIEIKEIEVKAEVDLERDLIDNKEGILDILAKIDNGTTVDIEMQMQNQYNMKERSLYYWAGLYYNGLIRGKNYRENNRVVTINILNFNMFKEGPYHEVARIRREYKNTLLTNELEMHFIQMPKFEKEGKEKENKKLWQWLKFINGKDKKGVEKAMEENKKIKEASNELEHLTGDEAIRRKAFLREKAIKDYVTNIEGAREEGEKRKELEMTKRMIEKGIPIKTIMELTGLTEEQINELSEGKE